MPEQLCALSVNHLQNPVSIPNAPFDQIRKGDFLSACASHIYNTPPNTPVLEHISHTPGLCTTTNNNMADPLSIAASIAGLLTLGTQVTVGLTQIVSDAKAAHSLLTEISNDLLMLCEILRKIETLISKWRESAADALLPVVLEVCRGSLKELQTTITTVQETFVRGGMQKRWLQATWSSKKKEIAAISCKISDYKSTLTLTLQMQNA